MKEKIKNIVKNKYFKISLYIIISLLLYLLYTYILNVYVLSNCNLISWWLGYAWYTCYWYYWLFNNILIYIYILSLWVILPIFFDRNKKYYYLYFTWIILIFIIILFIVINNPIININDLPNWNSIFK